MEDCTIRVYRAGDEVEINRLFNEVFGAARTLDEWNWKFRENPTNALVIAVAESGGRIVGQYSGVTAFFQYLDDVIRVTVPVDNFVDPRFRGGLKGVQKDLYDFQKRLWAQPLSCGFPNHAAYVVGKRILKYRDLGTIPVLFRRLSFRLAVRRRMPWLPRPLLALVHRASNAAFRTLVGIGGPRAAPGVRTRVVESFDARIDALWERARAKHRILCVRDRRYLDWRYRKPGARYRIIIAERGADLLGYVVTGLKREAEATEGHVVDLFADDSPGVLGALLRHAVRDLLARRADYALCWMLPDEAAYGALRQTGFAPNPVFAPNNIVYEIYDQQLIDERIAADPTNWYLTMGDSDFY